MQRCEGIKCTNHNQCLLNFCGAIDSDTSTCSAKKRKVQIEGLLSTYLYCGIGFVGAFVCWIVLQCFMNKRRLKLMAAEEENMAISEGLKDD